MSVSTIGTKGVPRTERERQIVAAAVGEFGARGYAGTSVVEVARAAGISKPLIYQYFESKDGLYLACVHDVGAGVLHRLQQAELAVDDTVRSRIHPLRAVFEALEPQPDAWRLLFDRSRPHDGPIAEAGREYRDAVISLATTGSRRFLAARGVDESEDASLLAHVWMGVVDTCVRWWLHHPDQSAQDMVRRCSRLIAAISA